MITTKDIGGAETYPSSWPVPKRLRPAIRCHALKTNGEPCRAFAIHGMEVCRAHDGASPQAQMMASIRLAEAAMERRMTRPCRARCRRYRCPDKEWGEQIKAVVKPADSVEPSGELAAEIIAALDGRKMKWPKPIDFVAELPHHPSGMLLKRRLRDPYWVDRAMAI